MEDSDKELTVGVEDILHKEGLSGEDIFNLTPEAKERPQSTSYWLKDLIVKNSYVTDTVSCISFFFYFSICITLY